MSSKKLKVNSKKKTISVEDLPEEVLIYTLQQISPYTDLQNCASVSKKWGYCVDRVQKTINRHFLKSLLNFNIKWIDVPLEAASSSLNRNSSTGQEIKITPRHSHSACIYDNSMYIFGGCTENSTTFNDLWILDLNTRLWTRPLAMGTYPTPKACASLVAYNNCLYLFGGWSHPSPYPLHQAWRLFDEFHEYNIETKRWRMLYSPSTPPKVAGHSATIHDNNMIIFGGLQKQNEFDSFEKSDEVWLYNFNTDNWIRKITSDPKPCGRYGQWQIALDNTHLLIIGGCGGTIVYSDIWLLDMGDGTNNSNKIWQWTKLDIIGAQNAPGHLWCHAATKVDQYVITFAKNPESTCPPMTPRTLRQSSSNTVELPAKRNSGALDDNVNGKRGTFNRKPSTNYEIDQSGPSNVVYSSNARPGVSALLRNTAQPSIKPNSMRNRELRLEILQQMEERLKSFNPPQPQPPPQPTTAPKGNCMSMFILDTSEAIALNRVTWLPYKPNYGPQETILYSLVTGNGELIMFGGVEREAETFNSDRPGGTACNNLRSITVPPEII